MQTRVKADVASDQFAEAVAAEADFAVVSTPNFLHLEHTRALLASGKHVLLQKPMARGLSEAQEIYKAHLAHPDQQLGIYMSMLDSGYWWNIRESLLAGEGIGEIVQIVIRAAHTGGVAWCAQPGTPWRFSLEKSGGGVFIMLAIHYIHDATNPYNQHRQFVEALRDAKSPVVPAIEGLRDMQVVDAVYRSVQTKQWENISYV